MTASFVDSNIWLYALVQKQNEKDKGKHEVATQVIQPGMIISEQVIAEVTANLIRKTDTSSQEITAYLKEFYSLYQVVYPDLDMHLQAQQLRENYCFSFWDSLIVAAALKANCETLYSEDMQDGLLVNKTLRIINPLINSKDK